MTKFHVMRGDYLVNGYISDLHGRRLYVCAYNGAAHEYDNQSDRPDWRRGQLKIGADGGIIISGSVRFLPDDGEIERLESHGLRFTQLNQEDQTMTNQDYPSMELSTLWAFDSRGGFLAINLPRRVSAYAPAGSREARQASVKPQVTADTMLLARAQSPEPQPAADVDLAFKHMAKLLGLIPPGD